MSGEIGPEEERARGEQPEAGSGLLDVHDKREMATSHRDRGPAGGVWQGVNPRTGSVALAIRVTRPAPLHAMQGGNGS
jgi:hypothetical protein